MVTDGKPSAMFEDNGTLYKNSFGLDPKIINKTLDEAVALRREKVQISTFMIAQDNYLIDFVEEMTKAIRRSSLLLAHGCASGASRFVCAFKDFLYSSNHIL